MVGLHRRRRKKMSGLATFVFRMTFLLTTSSFGRLGLGRLGLGRIGFGRLCRGQGRISRCRRRCRRGRGRCGAEVRP